MRYAFIFAALATILGPSAANAGTTGEIVGSVVNFTTGAPIAGAKVTATSGAQIVSTTSDARGNFAFVSLVPGDYRVIVERDGFDYTSILGATVLADEASRVIARAKPVVLVFIHMGGLYVSRQGISRGIVSDVYRYRGSTFDSFSWESPLPNMRLIQMTPGITFGAGAPVTH